jgi:hypothetical protein
MSPYSVLSSDLDRLMKLDDASSDLNSNLGPDSTLQATSWLKVLNMEPKDDNWLLFGNSRDLSEDCKFVGHCISFPQLIMLTMLRDYLFTMSWIGQPCGYLDLNKYT